MPEVDILLAAYNGEKFIGEQIESILAQTFQDFRLVIRDDGSSDNTPAIIEDYAAKYPGKIEVVRDDVVCKSPTKNFFELLKHAEAEYVMFSDQDDYWLPYKLEAILWHMKEAERDNPGKPVMVFTGFEVVDEHLHSMKILGSVDVPEYLYSFNTMLMMNNCVAGCTEMINRALYESMGGYDDRCGYHDAYSALYASALGVIVHVAMASIKYRQHANNDTGYSGGGGGNDTLLKIAKSYVKRWKRFPHLLGRAQLFRERFSEQLSPENLELLDKFIALLSKNRLSRFLTLITGRYPVPGRLAFKIKFITKAMLC